MVIAPYISWGCPTWASAKDEIHSTHPQSSRCKRKTRSCQERAVTITTLGDVLGQTMSTP